MWDLNSPLRDQTHTSCIGRWNFNHWTTRELPGEFILKLVFWKWGGMRSLLQIALGMQVNECCENPNKYQFKRGFILFPCQEVYLSGWSKATKDQASWWKVELRGTSPFRSRSMKLPSGTSLCPWVQEISYSISQILTHSSHKWGKWWYSSPPEDIQMCCLQKPKASGKISQAYCKTRKVWDVLVRTFLLPSRRKQSFSSFGSPWKQTVSNRHWRGPSTSFKTRVQ